MSPPDNSKTSSRSASATGRNVTDHQSKFGEIGKHLFRTYRFFVSGIVFIFVSTLMAGAGCLSNILSKATLNSVHYQTGVSVTGNTSMTGCTIAGMGDPTILLTSAMFSAVIFLIIRFLG